MIQRVAVITGHALAAGGTMVLIDGEPLEACPGDEDTPNDCYDWGNSAGAVMLLARAMLYATLGDRAAAWALAPEYARAELSRIDSRKWMTLTSSVLAWVESDPARAVWLGRN